MKKILLISMGFLSACSASTHRLTDGQWRGVFEAQNTEIPFIFEVKSAETENPTVTLLNGEDRLDLSYVTYRNDSVIIPIRIYDAVLEAHVEGERMSGRLVKLYSNRPDGRVPFTAQKGVMTRFADTGNKAAVSLDGRWEITVPDRDMAKQVGVFTQKADGSLTGSILTPTGDYRYLEGSVQADRFYLSAFAGMTPYLIRGQCTGVDNFTAEFITPGGISRFEGVRNPDAALPDAYAMTTLQPGYASLGFRLPDLDGREVSLTDPKYNGKVVIVSLLGSWCPNCMDETAFLAPWYKANHARGVEVVGLAFERKNDIEYARNQLSVFIEQLGVTYDILFAGSTGDETVAKVLPELSRLMSYPTTFFIDKKGNVRKIHTGFSGPATGKFYEEFKINFNRTVDELIDE
jgi:thiol-disulfide isomerase/thioredoxin